MAKLVSYITKCCDGQRTRSVYIHITLDTYHTQTHLTHTYTHHILHTCTHTHAGTGGVPDPVVDVPGQHPQEEASSPLHSAQGSALSRESALVPRMGSSGKRNKWTSPRRQKRLALAGSDRWLSMRTGQRTPSGCGTLGLETEKREETRPEREARCHAQEPGITESMRSHSVSD